jgi:hypothetical protein
MACLFTLWFTADCFGGGFICAGSWLKSALGLIVASRCCNFACKFSFHVPATNTILMKKEYWLPSVVFLAASIPTVLVLQFMGWGGDYVLLLAMGVGALATSFILPKLKKPELNDVTASQSVPSPQSKKKQ